MLVYHAYFPADNRVSQDLQVNLVPEDQEERLEGM